MIVVDTNVISELMRGEPHPAVLSWVTAQPRALLYATYVSQAEILYGLPPCPRDAGGPRWRRQRKPCSPRISPGGSCPSRGERRSVIRNRLGPASGRETDREIRCADCGDRAGSRRQHRHARYRRIYGLRPHRDRSMDGIIKRVDPARLRPGMRERSDHGKGGRRNRQPRPDRGHSTAKMMDHMRGRGQSCC